MMGSGDKRQDSNGAQEHNRPGGTMDDHQCHVTAAATTTILKACHFGSSWNWVRQDALLMYYDIIFGQHTIVKNTFLLYLEKQS